LVPEKKVEGEEAIRGSDIWVGEEGVEFVRGERREERGKGGVLGRRRFV